MYIEGNDFSSGKLNGVTIDNSMGNGIFFKGEFQVFSENVLVKSNL